MTKTEVKTLLNKIKGYYNSQFFVDEYVIDAWTESMQPYDLEDALEHIQEYVRDFPDIAPKPQTFKRNLLTREQKIERANANYTISCNLCKRWMTLQEYEDHYDRCLDIQYLLSIAKKKGESFTREQLEDCREEVIRGLLAKYPAV